MSENLQTFVPCFRTVGKLADYWHGSYKKSTEIAL